MAIRAKPTYAARNVLLITLRFSSYDDYLASGLWARIRAAVLTRDNNQCRLCSKENCVVHRLNYDEATLLGESLDSLVSLCRECHTKVEFTKKGKKRMLVDVMATYQMLYNKRIPKKDKNKCVLCKNNKARKNSTMCRPCSKIHKL